MMEGMVCLKVEGQVVRCRKSEGEKRDLDAKSIKLINTALFLLQFIVIIVFLRRNTR
jgi:hypothetical protein